MHLFCFHMLNFVSRGSSKCLIFKWLVQKYFNLKINFFAMPANMEWHYYSVENLEKIIRSKYRRAAPEIPVFFILRCLKMRH